MTGFDSKRQAAMDKLVEIQEELGMYDDQKPEPRLDQGPDYERGFVDGMMYQTQSSVDKAVNRMTQLAQEPVAWIGDSPTRGNGKRLFWTKGEAYHYATKHYPLFTAPPQRPWVGLTEREVRQMCGSVPSMQEAVREAEAKLKEKNFD